MLKISELERGLNLLRWLDANNSPSELMSVLSPALRARPTAGTREEVLRRILPGLQHSSSPNPWCRMTMPFGFGTLNDQW